MFDEYVLDSGAWKILSHDVPIPLVPKTVEEIRSDEDKLSRHQRLLNRLQSSDLIERKVEGNGNSLFRALSDQLLGSPEHYEFVRDQIVLQLEFHPELYEAYIDVSYSDYLKMMSKSGQWGDHVTLQAAADLYGVKIVINKFCIGKCCVEIPPLRQESERVIFLSLADEHCNSICPKGEFKVMNDPQISSQDTVMKECGVFVTERSTEDVRSQCPNSIMSYGMLPGHVLKREATLAMGHKPGNNTQGKLQGPRTNRSWDNAKTCMKRPATSEPGYEPPKKVMRKHKTGDIKGKLQSAKKCTKLVATCEARNEPPRELGRKHTAGDIKGK